MDAELNVVIVLLMIAILYIFTAYILKDADDKKDKAVVKTTYKAESSYKPISSSIFDAPLKKQLRKEILESKDFESCILSLAEYSTFFGIKKNPEDFILFKEHLDKLTIHE